MGRFVRNAYSKMKHESESKTKLTEGERYDWDRTRKPKLHRLEVLGEEIHKLDDNNRKRLDKLRGANLHQKDL